MGARRVFDFLTSMPSLEINFKDTSTFKVSNESLNQRLSADVSFVSILAMVFSENLKRLEGFFFLNFIMFMKSRKFFFSKIFLQPFSKF